jgi:Tfp pilus assembly protein PilF
LWMVTKQWDQAEAAFKKALDLNSSVLDSYMNLAELYTKVGKVDQAIHEYKTALSKDSKYVPAQMMLGVIFESNKDTVNAQSAYEAVLKVSPKFAPAANNLAWLLIEHGGNSDLALSYAQVAREQQPTDPHIADTIGWIYYKKGIYLKSLSLLEEAVAKIPDEPAVLYHYGMAQFKQGDTVGARTSLRAALKLNQSFVGSQEAKRVLDSL